VTPALVRAARIIPANPYSANGDSMLRIMLPIALLFCAALASAQTSADVQVWAASSLSKTRPDDGPQAFNLVWTQRTKTITIAGAKNEHIPFQVVLTVAPPATRQEKPADGFFVEASDLASAQRRIVRERVKLYFVHDILCYGASSPVGKAGFWPDALAPLTDPFGMAAEFRSTVRNRAIWIDVVTAADTPAGDYTGTIRVTHNGSAVDTLNVKLKVYDFALPAETHLITYMGVSARGLAAFHDITPGSREEKALLRKYHAFLYENRMEPWFNEALQPEIRVAGDQVNLRFDEQAYEQNVTQWHTKRVILESVPRRLAGTPALVRSYVGQVAAFYKQHGWLNRLVFNSPIDEPNSAEAFEETRKWATLVHEAAPGVPFLATKSPAGGNPEWGPLAGYVNNFSVHGNDLNRLAVKDAIRAEQAKGGEITWYISCDQVYPQPNYFIDAPSMDPVIVSQQVN
jgi:hypothetical protein